MDSESAGASRKGLWDILEAREFVLSPTLQQVGKSGRQLFLLSDHCSLVSVLLLGEVKVDTNEIEEEQGAGMSLVVQNDVAFQGNVGSRLGLWLRDGRDNLDGLLLLGVVVGHD